MKLMATPQFISGSTDQYTVCATEMALVHNAISRAFNGIYQQALFVQPYEYSSFVAYCLACFKGLEAHHKGEEDHLFPEIEKATGKKGLMEVNVAQHEAFHSGLHKWGEYVSSLNSGDPSKYSGQEMIAIMDEFLEPLSQHLNDEIPTLIALAEYGDKLDLKGIMDKEAEQVLAHMSKTTQIPVVLLNHDVTFEGGMHNFPPIPGPVRWVLMRVCTMFHSDWWRFATCDTAGKPKPLYRFATVCD